MRENDPLNSPLLQSKALLWLLMIVTVLFAVVLWPLSGAVSWAVFIAIVFSPLQERSAHVCRGRRGWAAFGTLVVIIVSVLLPTALLTASITQEAAAFYERFKTGDISLSEYFQRGIDALPSWVRGGLDRLGLADLSEVQRKLVEALGRSSQALTSRVMTIGQNTLEFVVNLFVMLYVLFFLLRDGKALSAQAARALPLEKRHTERLLKQFATVVRATVKGNVVVAAYDSAPIFVARISPGTMTAAIFAILVGLAGAYAVRVREDPEARGLGVRDQLPARRARPDRERGGRSFVRDAAPTDGDSVAARARSGQDPRTRMAHRPRPRARSPRPAPEKGSLRGRTATASRASPARRRRLP